MMGSLLPIMLALSIGASLQIAVFVKSRSSGAKAPIIAVALYLLFLGTAIAAFNYSRRGHYFWAKPAGYMMGFLACFLVYANVAFVLGLLSNFAGRDLASKLKPAIASAGIYVSAFAFVFASINATLVKTKNYEVAINKESKLPSLKILLASDLHLGAIHEANWAEKVAGKINSASPELVVIAGDIIDGDYNAIKDPERIIRALSSIESKYGVYAVLGNHDSGSSYEPVKEMLSRSNITLLEDESVEFEGSFILSGRRDARPIRGAGGVPRQALADYSPAGSKLPIIVIDHQPTQLGSYKEPVDLVLCGHTHRGQIFPFNFITKSMYIVDYGYYDNNGAYPKVIVSSGAGTWAAPLRSGSDCEVVLINAVFR